MHKKFIESIIESTKISVTPEGYEIEHTIDNSIRTWNIATGVRNLTMITSNHTFLLEPDTRRLSIYSYRGNYTAEKLFEVNDGHMKFFSEEATSLPLTEEQYFQQNTLYDFYDLELEDMLMIHEFYTVVSEYMLKHCRVS